MSLCGQKNYVVCVCVSVCVCVCVSACVCVCVCVCRAYVYHQNVLPRGRSFTANSDTKVAVLFKGRSSTANSGTKVAVLLGMNRCGSFPLLSLASEQILKDLKRSQGHQRGGEELTLVVNFSEVRRALWDLFRSFKICSDAKESNGKLPHLFMCVCVCVCLSEMKATYKEME